MVQLFQVTTVQAAWSKLWDHLGQVGTRTEKVSLAEALGRVLAGGINSPLAVPGFARSTVDGFAVLAEDTFGASEALPAMLTVAGEVLMGQEAAVPIARGKAVRIATGGMLPPGSDAVVMIEYTEELDHRDITVLRPAAPGENVIQAGEDVGLGDRILPDGWQLRPQDLGVLAGIGLSEIPVYARPRVGIISTGDELVGPDEVPGPGQVRDINSYTIFGMVQQNGGIPKLYGIVRDHYELLEQKVNAAVEENDLVVISGGSSVGTRDATGRVIEGLGAPGILAHGLSIRPGKPTILGMVGNKPVFGLPGHPVAAMVVFDLLIKPTMKHLLGLTRARPEPEAAAKVSRNVASGPGREDFVRVMLEQRNGELWAVPVLGKSGLISTMVRADGIFRIPLDQEGVMAGEVVQVRLF